MFLAARDREAAHRVVKPELFLGQVQQFLKQRVLEIPKGHHEPPLGFPNIDCEVALLYVAGGSESRPDSRRKASVELLVLLPLANVSHQLDPHGCMCGFWLKLR